MESVENLHRCRVEPPSWAGDLVRLWVVGETAAESGRLGWSSVSPMFKRLGEAAPETDGSYSGTEVAAMAVAIDRLSLTHPLEFAALQARYRPRVASQLGLKPNEELLNAALARLAQMVDDLVDKP